MIVKCNNFRKRTLVYFIPSHRKHIEFIIEGISLVSLHLFPQKLPIKDVTLGNQFYHQKMPIHHSSQNEFNIVASNLEKTTERVR